MVAQMEIFLIWFLSSQNKRKNCRQLFVLFKWETNQIFQDFTVHCKQFSVYLHSKYKKPMKWILIYFFYSNRQDYHGGSSATNLNVAGPFPVLSPPTHHHHHIGPQGAVQQVAIQQVAGPKVANPIVVSPLVAIPEVANTQVVGPQVAIQQVAGPQVAVQQVAQHQVPGFPVGGHHITGHQAAHYPVPRYQVPRYPVTHHSVANHLAADHQGARFKRSPQFFQRFSAGAQSVNCPNGGCFQTQQVQLPGLSPVGFRYIF